MTLFIVKVFAIVAIILANAIPRIYALRECVGWQALPARQPCYAFIEKQTVIGGSGPNSDHDSP